MAERAHIAGDYQDLKIGTREYYKKWCEDNACLQSENEAISRMQKHDEVIDVYEDIYNFLSDYELEDQFSEGMNAKQAAGKIDKVDRYFYSLPSALFEEDMDLNKPFLDTAKKIHYFYNERIF